MFKKLLTITCILTAASCTPAPALADQQSENNAKEYIGAMMLDPESVKFRNVQTKIGEKYYVVIGEVNAKNRYGGYVGYKMFVVNCNMSDRKPVDHFMEGE